MNRIMWRGDVFDVDDVHFTPEQIGVIIARTLMAGNEIVDYGALQLRSITVNYRVELLRLAGRYGEFCQDVNNLEEIANVPRTAPRQAANSAKKRHRRSRQRSS